MCISKYWSQLIYNLFLGSYTVTEPLTFLFCSLMFCSLRNNKISADGVLILAGALVVNKNLKLEWVRLLMYYRHMDGSMYPVPWSWFSQELSICDQQLNVYVKVFAKPLNMRQVIVQWWDHMHTYIRDVATGPVSPVSTGPLFPSPMACLPLPNKANVQRTRTAGWHVEI